MIAFLESTLAEALAAGCDCVQIKYEGIFAQYHPVTGNLTLKGDGTPRSYAAPAAGVRATLIGSYAPLTNSLVIFDCWAVEEPPENLVDLRREGYRTRYMAARLQIKLLISPPPLVQNLPIAEAGRLWTTLPDVPGARGLVFRRSKDPVGAVVRLTKWYPEVPRGLV